MQFFFFLSLLKINIHVYKKSLISCALMSHFWCANWYFFLKNLHLFIRSWQIICLQYVSPFRSHIGICVLHACLCLCVCFTPSNGSWRTFLYERSPLLCYHRNSYCMSPLFGKVSMNHPLSSDWSACPKVILACLTNKLFNWVIKTSLERDCKDMNTHLNTVLLEFTEL